VSAPVLRGEIERARELLSKPIAEFAISLRTKAAFSMFAPPLEAGTVLATEAGWSVPFSLEGAQTLGDVFGTFVDDLLRVTEGAKEGDEVEVLDT